MLGREERVQQERPKFSEFLNCTHAKQGREWEGGGGMCREEEASGVKQEKISNREEIVGKEETDKEGERDWNWEQWNCDGDTKKKYRKWKDMKKR